MTHPWTKSGHLTPEQDFQKRLRCRLAVWAWAYEGLNESLVDDHMFDKECLRVDLDVDTDSPEWDLWWRENFSPETGAWINKHPDKKRLTELVSIFKGFR